MEARSRSTTAERPRRRREDRSQIAKKWSANGGNKDAIVEADAGDQGRRNNEKMSAPQACILRPRNVPRARGARLDDANPPPGFL